MGAKRKNGIETQMGELLGANIVSGELLPSMAGICDDRAMGFQPKPLLCEASTGRRKAQRAGRNLFVSADGEQASISILARLDLFTRYIHGVI
jgi:hypothetical protein